MHRFVDKKMSTGIISSEEKGNTLIYLYLLVYIPILRWKQVRQLGAFPKSLEVLTRTRVERTIQTVHSLAPVSSAMLTRIQWSFGGAVAPDRMFIWDELSSPSSVLSWSMRYLSSLVNLSIMYTVVLVREEWGSEHRSDRGFTIIEIFLVLPPFLFLCNIIIGDQFIKFPLRENHHFLWRQLQLSTITFLFVAINQYIFVATSWFPLNYFTG